MNTHFETFEQTEARRLDFRRGKVNGQNRVVNIPREERLEAAKESAAQYTQALQPDSQITYAYAQGDWYGVDYHGHTLSMVRAMIEGEIE